MLIAVTNGLRIRLDDVEIIRKTFLDKTADFTKLNSFDITKWQSGLMCRQALIAVAQGLVQLVDWLVQEMINVARNLKSPFA